jgi:hypothetical protein
MPKQKYELTGKVKWLPPKTKYFFLTFTNQLGETVKSNKTRRNGFTKLYQIRALRNFRPKSGGSVKAGDLGGWIDSTERLSQEDRSWIYGDSILTGPFTNLIDTIVTGSSIIDMRPHVTSSETTSLVSKSKFDRLRIALARLLVRGIPIE